MLFYRESAGNGYFFPDGFCGCPELPWDPVKKVISDFVYSDNLLL
jgi:hypothetical protein